jgi:mRNA deadenylase 3'-5' endonuclease subunit Ccr4
MATKTHTFRIITFNLLTPVFATPEYYPFTPVRHLNSAYRLDRAKKLIEKWTKANFIICLQEVSISWDSELKKLFDTLRYTYISKLYAGGKLGIAIGFPMAHFVMVEYDIFRCGNTIRNVCESIDKIGLSKTITNIDQIEAELKNASESDNTALTMRLKCLYMGQYTGHHLMVSTYHMPCRYTKKYIMATHIHSLKSRVAFLRSKWADNKCLDPFIIAGDFNITPKSSEYKYMIGDVYTKDELTESNSQNESLQFYSDLCQIYESIGIDFANTLQTSSAHYKKNNLEPAYTNVALQKDRKFINTIDYILISPEIDVMSCLVGLVCLTNPIASYPNIWCSSDHLPLSASLTII